MLPDLVCLWVGKYDVCTVDVANRLDAGCVKAGVIVVCLGESVHESPTLEQINIIEQDLDPPLLFQRIQDTLKCFRLRCLVSIDEQCFTYYAAKLGTSLQPVQESGKYFFHGDIDLSIGAALLKFLHQSRLEG